MNMRFERIVAKRMEDGLVVRLFPFHVSLEGMEEALLCRDGDDYDVLVKYIALAARKADVSVVTYDVVSNHAHMVVLSESEEVCRGFVLDLKRRYSMWLSRKYGEAKMLHRHVVDVQYLDSDWYLRNAIAYDIRNCLDNGANNVYEYRWTSYRCYFCDGGIPEKTIPVSSLSSRQAETILHSGENCSNVAWRLNERYELEPGSFCNWRYVEAAFGYDQAFFLRILGGVNTAEMTEKLVLAHSSRRTDGELFKTINEMSQKWYGRNVYDLSSSQKAKLIHYVYRSVRTSVNQLARCFGLPRDYVSGILGVKSASPGAEGGKK